MIYWRWQEAVMLYGCRLPLLIIDSVLMSALLGRSRDGSDTNGLPPSHCEVPPPLPPLLLALVVLSKQSFSPDCHRWSRRPQSQPPMGAWLGPVVIRAISGESGPLLGMPSAKADTGLVKGQCGPLTMVKSMAGHWSHI